jgi:hypothetical protein
VVNRSEFILEGSEPVFIWHGRTPVRTIPVSPNRRMEDSDVDEIQIGRAASVTIVAMSAMATTNAIAFTLFDPPCTRSAPTWACGDGMQFPETHRTKQTYRTHRSNASPDYMKNTDPRFNQSMQDAGGGGGGGGGGR